MRFQLVLFFLFLNLVAKAQDEGPLDAITALENNSKVYLKWTIKSGNTCNGIRIHRSSDSISFNTIGQINGICGSTTESISYTFTDDSPKLNAKNYYTIEMGDLGFSRIVSVEVFDFSAGIIVRPQPANEFVQLIFMNDRNEHYILQMYNLQGELMVEKSSETNRFEIDTNDFPNGIYVYKIVNEKLTPLTSNKIIVNR